MTINHKKRGRRIYNGLTRLKLFILVVLITLCHQAVPVFSDDFSNSHEFLSGYKGAYIITGADTEAYANQVKFQISLKYRIFKKGIFSKDNQIYFGYTQTSFWDLYNYQNSRNIYESTYQPELFCRRYFPGFFIGYIEGGYSHTSNGRAGYDSRSWDRHFLGLKLNLPNFGIFSKNKTKAIVRYWLPIESLIQATNSDIRDCIGNTRVTVFTSINDLILLKDVDLSCMIQPNKQKEPTISLGLEFRPFLQFADFIPRHYIQWWRGYGQNLLFYNEYQDQVRMGMKFNFE